MNFYFLEIDNKYGLHENRFTVVSYFRSFDNKTHNLRSQLFAVVESPIDNDVQYIEMFL